MYNLSARQILCLALLSAVFAAGTVACFDRFGGALQHSTSATGADNNIEPPAKVAGITDPSVATDEQNNIEVYKTLSPGVVNITSMMRPRGFFDEGGKGTGSGSVIDMDGRILTNYHVIEDADALTVDFGGGKNFPAKVVGRDPDTDLAVIQVNAPRELLHVISFGDSDRVIVGQKVLAIGNPFGLDRTLTTGVISGLQRPIQAENGRIIEGAIQTDASINPGNSGGPLLDSQGHMVGINSQIYSRSGGSVGIGFAIPANIARRIIPQLIRDGRVMRPKLGIVPYNVGNVRGLPVTEGVMVYQIDPNGSAAAAGLRAYSETQDGNVALGDIITSIDGQKVADQNDLFRILDKHQFNDTVQVEVFRNNQRKTFPVRLLPEQGRGTLRR